MDGYFAARGSTVSFGAHDAPPLVFRRLGSQSHTRWPTVAHMLTLPFRHRLRFLSDSGWWVVPALAAIILGLTVIPGEVWHAPANDAFYRGFDPNLIYVSASGGTVHVSTNSIDL